MIDINVPNRSALVLETKDSMVSFVTNHPPRRPRDGQLGQEKRRRKFSITGGSLGILLLTNQIHEFSSLIGYKKNFWCPIRGQDLNVSRCFRDLLIRRSSPPALSWRRAFSFSRKMSPQSLIYQFHSILLQRWGEKFNKFTNFKGREIFSCTCLTSLPRRLTKSTTWKISHEQAQNCSGVYEFTFDQSAVWFL